MLAVHEGENKYYMNRAPAEKAIKCLIHPRPHSERKRIVKIMEIAMYRPVDEILSSVWGRQTQNFFFLALINLDKMTQCFFVNKFGDSYCAKKVPEERKIFIRAFNKHEA